VNFQEICKLSALYADDFHLIKNFFLPRRRDWQIASNRKGQGAQLDDFRKGLKQQCFNNGLTGQSMDIDTLLSLLFISFLRHPL